MKCPICKDGGKVKEKNISVPIGKEIFRTKTAVYEKCGHYALTPKVRKEMDQCEVLSSSKAFISHEHPIVLRQAHQSFLVKVEGRHPDPVSDASESTKNRYRRSLNK